jgi:hypothetical protein
VYKLWSSSLCSLLHSPAILSLLGPNILLSTLFLNTLSLCSYLSVTDQVPHPYKTTGKIIVLCTVIYLWVANCKAKDSAPNDSKHSLTSVCSWFLQEWNFDMLGLFANTWTI